MDNKRQRTRTWRVLGCILMVVATLLGSYYWGWNAHRRPKVIAGTWYLDDLRTEEVESSPITFSVFGHVDADVEFGNRWSYADGKVVFQTWRLKTHSGLSRLLTDNALYAYLAGVDEFALTAELSEDDSVLTLIADDDGPRCRLSRVKP